MDSTQQTSKVKLTHYVWDDDVNESLCGIDTSNYIWAGVHGLNECPNCLEVKRFVDVFNMFNISYDVKESLEATIQAIKNEVMA